MFCDTSTNYIVLASTSRCGSTALIHALHSFRQQPIFTFWPTVPASPQDEIQGKIAELRTMVDAGPVILKQYHTFYDPFVEQLPSKKIFLYRRNLRDQMRSLIVARHNKKWHFTRRLDRDYVVQSQPHTTPLVLDNEPPFEEHGFTTYDTNVPEVLAYFENVRTWLTTLDRYMNDDSAALVCYEDLFDNHPNNPVWKGLIGHQPHMPWREAITPEELGRIHVRFSQTPPHYYINGIFENEAVYDTIFYELIQGFASRGIPVFSL